MPDREPSILGDRKMPLKTGMRASWSMGCQEWGSVLTVEEELDLLVIGKVDGESALQSSVLRLIFSNRY